MTSERDRLWMELAGRDTLSLRRLEREETVRDVLQWLMGPGFFTASPDEVSKPIEKLQNIEELFAKNLPPTIIKPGVGMGVVLPDIKIDWG